MECPQFSISTSFWTASSASFSASAAWEFRLLWLENTITFKYKSGSIRRPRFPAIFSWKSNKSALSSLNSTIFFIKSHANANNERPSKMKSGISVPVDDISSLSMWSFNGRKLESRPMMTSDSFFNSSDIFPKAKKFDNFFKFSSFSCKANWRTRTAVSSVSSLSGVERLSLTTSWTRLCTLNTFDWRSNENREYIESTLRMVATSISDRALSLSSSSSSSGRPGLMTSTGIHPGFK